ncbi:hypothetical protein E6O75_ATG06752 [Venturia nashicola]|uniref:Uncharacterized protein n=1 Tax=Venturia nashicola TaxID=86259 RepID=A0A4Z1NU39_9PEZI|nr:hypothetical protein E6O75_ATG06752 [Venturia nashicola]
MTTAYNVYRVYFAQLTGPDLVGIALVPAQLADQGKGRFYHVKGNVGMGMDYEARPAYNFSGSKSFDRKEYLFQLPKSQLSEFESIASASKPPHDERVLLERNPASLDPPAPDCTTWVDEVLELAQRL